jgi:hypothetical protein
VVRETAVSPGDEELCLRGSATAVVCCAAYARTTPGAAVHRLAGADAAVVPDGPEHEVFNNAIVDHGLGAAAGSAVVEAVAGAYASAGGEYGPQKIA